MARRRPLSSARRWRASIGPPARRLGARIRLGGRLVTVVGVVGDVRNDLARPDAEPMTYRSHRQESTQRFCVLLRTHGDPLALVRPLQREVAALDPSLPVQQAMTLDAAVGEGLAARRLPVMLMTAFSALALLLASVGVYGMFASMAAAREREFGVRMALGSRPSAIAGLMLRQGVGWMAVGLSGGALGITLVVQLLRGMLYGVPPFATRSPSAVPSLSWWVARRSRCLSQSAAPCAWTQWSRSAPNEAPR